jgi:glutamate/tyrosine decarboxylase-like PLP-dependent enzyme
LALRQAGREGYAGMISDDIKLAQELYRVVERQMRPSVQENRKTKKGTFDERS